MNAFYTSTKYTIIENTYTTTNTYHIIPTNVTDTIATNDTTDKYITITNNTYHIIPMHVSYTSTKNTITDKTYSTMITPYHTIQINVFDTIKTRNTITDKIYTTMTSNIYHFTPTNVYINKISEVTNITTISEYSKTIKARTTKIKYAIETRTSTARSNYTNGDNKIISKTNVNIITPNTYMSINYNLNTIPVIKDYVATYKLNTITRKTKIIIVIHSSDTMIELYETRTRTNSNDAIKTNKTKSNDTTKTRTTTATNKYKKTKIKTMSILFHLWWHFGINALGRTRSACEEGDQIILALPGQERMVDFPRPQALYILPCIKPYPQQPATIDRTH